MALKISRNGALAASGSGSGSGTASAGPGKNAKARGKGGAGNGGGSGKGLGRGARKADTLTRPAVAVRHGRFVLFVGDEGAILTYADKTMVQRRLFAPSPASEHTEAMRTLLEADPAAPIWLLLDSMDQSYQRQTLPPVAKVSLGKIIQRRLDRDFPPEDITGALEIGREKDGRKDWNYLLVAISTAGTVPQWLDLLLDRENPFKGIFLSPVESEKLIIDLAATADGADFSVMPQSDKNGKAVKRKKAKVANSELGWQLLISHHKVGGFRLVVLHEGKLAFTRLAQPVGETLPEVVAGNVEQETLNTIEYMKRIGYQESQSLQVLIIVSGEIKQSLDTRNIPAQSVHFFTPYEAAGALGLAGVAQPEDHYADILQSVHLLTLRKHRLVLQNKQTKTIAAFANAALAVRALAAMIALGLFGYGLFQAWQGYSFSEELARLERDKQTQAQRLAEMQEHMKQFPTNIKQMLDVSRLYGHYSKATQYFSASAHAGLTAIPHDIFALSDSRWERRQAPAAYSGGPTTEQSDLLVKGDVMKAATDTLDILKKRLEDILRRARAAYPAADVQFGDLPQIFSDSSELKTTIGGSAETDAFQKMMAEPLRIELRVKSPKSPAAPGAAR